MARDIRKCEPGQAQYTVWCDENGYLIQDGVALRLDEHEFLLTSAEPSLRYFRQTARQIDLSNVEIEDVSSGYGILALQGPHAHSVLSKVATNVTPLKYFSGSQIRDRR